MKKHKGRARAGGAFENDTDAFLWLEEIEGERALEWVRSQNLRSLAELEADPRFAPFRAAALAIVNSKDRLPSPSLLPGRVGNFWQDEKNVRGVWRWSPLSAYLSGTPDWRTILDIDELAANENENWVFAGVTALAPTHERAILSLSRGGSDAVVRREFHIGERRFVENGFEFAEAKGSVAWLNEDAILAAIADSPGASTDSGYPRLIRKFVRGDGMDKAPVIFEAKKTDIGVWPSTFFNRGASYYFITRAISFFDSEYYWMKEGLAPVKLEAPKKSEICGVFDGRLILRLQEVWRKSFKTYRAGDIIALSLESGSVERVYRPGRQQAVSGVVASETAILAEILDNVIGRVVRLRRENGRWLGERINSPGDGVSTLSGVNPYGDDFFIDFESPAQAPALCYVKGDRPIQKIMSGPAFFDASDVVMKQRFAKSSDGVKIPYFVIGKSSVIKNGQAPTIQYGYGGFEVPSTPVYSGVMGKLWLERGGVYVIANIRGGGEFGPKWHQAALKENRQLGFDDFFAVSQDIIRTGLSSPGRLGAYGGSNGGLLMGVALTQRPDLYAALAIGVPLLDMLRYPLLLAGSSWVGEYGDPSAPSERAALERYSPYHNISPDRSYPRPFFFTSTKDDRVHPGHARKMAAKMAEFGLEFLYYENIEGGHGAAANQIQAAHRAALQYVYFSRQLMGD